MKRSKTRTRGARTKTRSTRSALKMLAVRATTTGHLLNKHVTTSPSGRKPEDQGRHDTLANDCSPSTRERDIIHVKAMKCRANASSPVPRACYDPTGRSPRRQHTRRSTMRKHHKHSHTINHAISTTTSNRDESHRSSRSRHQVLSTRDPSTSVDAKPNEAAVRDGQTGLALAQCSSI